MSAEVSRPLSELDQVDWAGLEHAYGTADDVPGLLRKLASDDFDERDQAIHELYGNIWHQGTVYEATAFAVPFLIHLLQSGELEPLSLLTCIAHRSGYYEVQQIYDDPSTIAKPSYQEKLRKERQWVEAAHTAVARGFEYYRPLLNDALPDVRGPLPF